MTTFARLLLIIEKQNLQSHAVDNLSKKYKAEKSMPFFFHSMIQYIDKIIDPNCRSAGTVEHFQIRRGQAIRWSKLFKGEFLK